MDIDTALFALLAIGILIVIWIIAKYNQLVGLRNRIENAWSQIDVQLKRRADLIPNLVETVKGYAQHEQEVFENVTNARSAMLKAQSVRESAQAQNQMTDALKTLFAVAENYPELKANENFMMLQEELTGTASKIAYARQFYNDQVMAYNTLIQSFPVNIIANSFNFQEREYFPVDDASREDVEVKF